VNEKTEGKTPENSMTPGGGGGDSSLNGKKGDNFGKKGRKRSHDKGKDRFFLSLSIVKGGKKNMMRSCMTERSGLVWEKRKY